MGGVTAVPKANQAAPHPTSAPSDPLQHSHRVLIVFTQHPWHHRRCHILANPSEDSTQSTSLQYSHKTSLITEQERLTSSQTIVIFSLKYIGLWLDNYKDTCYSHSFYLQSVLHSINTDLCKIQLNEKTDILWLILLDCNIFLNHLFRNIWKRHLKTSKSFSFGTSLLNFHGTN